MKYYAFEGGIGTEPRENSIEISQSQYNEAIERVTDIVTVKNGVFELVALEQVEFILNGKKCTGLKHLIPEGALLYDNPEDWYMEDSKYIFADTAYKVKCRIEDEKQQIINMLDILDSKGERAGREVALAVAKNEIPPATAVEKLQSLEAQAQELRIKLAALG